MNHSRAHSKRSPPCFDNWRVISLPNFCSETSTHTYQAKVYMSTAMHIENEEWESCKQFTSKTRFSVAFKPHYGLELCYMKQLKRVDLSAVISHLNSGQCGDCTIQKHNQICIWLPHQPPMRNGENNTLLHIKFRNQLWELAQFVVLNTNYITRHLCYFEARLCIPKKKCKINIPSLSQEP